MEEALDERPLSANITMGELKDGIRQVLAEGQKPKLKLNDKGEVSDLYLRMDALQLFKYGIF